MSRWLLARLMMLGCAWLVTSCVSESFYYPAVEPFVSARESDRDENRASFYTPVRTLSFQEYGPNGRSSNGRTVSQSISGRIFTFQLGASL